MRSFFLRELRRQAVPGLAVLGLGVLILALVRLVGSPSTQASAPGLVLGLLVLAAPWLVSVATVAPDAESGAAAFLGTLPVSPTRVLLVRCLAALPWAVLPPLAFGAFTVWGDFDRARGPGAVVDAVLAGAAVGGGVFGAGLCASAAVRRTLVAFVAAPAFLLVPWLLYAEGARALGAPWVFEAAIPLVAVPALVVAAVLANARARGAAVAPSLRAALAVLAGALALGAATTTAAYAHARLTAPWLVGTGCLLSTPDGARAWVALARDGSTGWSDWPPDVRCLRLDRASSGAPPAELRSDGEPRLLALSPDGQAILAYDDEADALELLDAAGRRVGEPARPARGAARIHVGSTPVQLAWPDARYPGCARAPGVLAVAWAGGRRPFLVSGGGPPFRVVPWDGVWDGAGVEVALPPDAERVLAVCGARLLLRRAGGACSVVDLDAPGAAIDLALPGGLHLLDAVLLDQGRAALVLAGSGNEPADEGSLWWVDVGAGRADPGLVVARDLVLTVRARLFPGAYVSCAPGGGRLLVSVVVDDEHAPASYATGFVDVATGWFTRLPERDVPVHTAAWSPSGRRVATNAGVFDVASPGARLALPGDASVWWADEDRLLVGPEPCFLDVRTGQRTPAGF